MVRSLMKLPEESVEDYLAQRCGDEGFDCDLLRAVADANRKWGAKTGVRSRRSDRGMAGAVADRARGSASGSAESC